MLFTFGQYRLDIDVERTHEFYSRAEKITDGCSCDDCRNYELATDFFPLEVQEFFAKMGVDLKKAAELCPYVAEDNGKKMVYGGFYHICGTLLSDANCWVPVVKNKNAETFHLDDDGLYLITDGYAVGFTKNCSLLEENFPLPAIQMEISFHCPWVLSPLT